MLFSTRAVVAVALAIAAPAAAGAETLTLEAAVARVLATAPEVRAAAARIEALQAARTQAGVRPNPTVELFAENLAGTGPYQTVEAAEVTGSYAQTIERGGKRQARVALAEREIGVAEAETAAQRLDLAARVQRAWVAVAAARAEVDVAADRLKAAQALAREVDRRVRAARDPLFAGTRAATRVAEAQVDVELAEHAHEAALTRLAALWGGTPEGVEVSTADFLAFDRPSPQTADEQAGPDAAIFAARADRARAAVAVERARSVQDPTVRGGLRYLRPADDVALVAGISIPLARHDTNRANVERAVAEQRRAAADAEVAEAQRRRDLFLARERVGEARMEAVAVRDRVIPGAERTLAQVREGYARGGFSYLDVAEAQRALGDARGRLVDAAREYHRAHVDLDRLTGRFAAVAAQQEPR